MVRSRGALFLWAGLRGEKLVGVAPTPSSFLACPAKSPDATSNRPSSTASRTPAGNGPGFAFVDRQGHFEVGGDDLYIDLRCVKDVRR
jgi:hypothetical protein